MIKAVEFGWYDLKQCARQVLAASSVGTTYHARRICRGHRSTPVGSSALSPSQAEKVMRCAQKKPVAQQGSSTANQYVDLAFKTPLALPLRRHVIVCPTGQTPPPVIKVVLSQISPDRRWVLARGSLVH
jgi:hypothetical protein